MQRRVRSRGERGGGVVSEGERGREDSRFVPGLALLQINKLHTHTINIHTCH